MPSEDLALFIEALRGPAPADEAARGRARGALLGLAAGNALGLPVESRGAADVARAYPEGLREVAPEELERPWDDDLAQTMIIAEALLQRGGLLDADDLAGRFLRWFEENGRGIGTLTRGVLLSLSHGVSPRSAAREAWELSGGSAGNGALMRCAPVALRWRADGAALIRESQNSSLVTHHDPRCVWSCVAFNVGLAAALNGVDLDWGRLARLLEEAGAPREVAEIVGRPRRGGVGSLHLDKDGIGFTIKALDVAVHALRRAPDFEETLIEIVAAGGDTDTNGAIAGAALGARFGADAVPRRWLERIRDIDRVQAAADALFDAGVPA
ncbi:MAG: ADP-ribosylglycohydrolase family protein [Candidatus Polarisedimenticolia bacterium]|nr:ADP-ribosylglycohydrolase family protein [bacterium]